MKSMEQVQLEGKSYDELCSLSGNAMIQKHAAEGEIIKLRQSGKSTKAAEERLKYWTKTYDAVIAQKSKLFGS